MVLLLLIGVVPAAYLIGLGVLFFRGRRRGLAVSLRNSPRPDDDFPARRIAELQADRCR